MPITLGIDEAGRGCMIGSMFVAGVVIDDRAEKVFKKYGVKDSKKLSKNKREKLYDIITSNALWFEVVEVTPLEIDNQNINYLTIRAMRKIANDATKEIKYLNRIIADIVGKGDFKLVESDNIEQLVLKKADENFIAVAAASIVAKVQRDRALEQIRNNFGLIGSGYPGDKKSVEWLKLHYSKIPREYIRTKWKTFKK
ncbi:ribonuclease HII [Fervidicoccus fontis]|uniref:Ribonuclease n=1 Tax=Fervidicoccus fontis TaxID=683846 RepID=A0A2J6N4G7_9CREN|nr:ribonuclease HII [Fervidicoccus fontis]MBE9391684.1 ribonuclease HII [Fervidicoccus fontis]PMB76113.1 MAG: ribonuclease HII [Fervidicoccus fontis]PMB77640.1 MAG: ribonuclease HII [Fervidicoccus fontis]HEW64402.1 ribonuclease HII [Fervidicoccus fontis]